MLTKCDVCIDFSKREYDLPFYNDPRDTAATGIMWFCSEACRYVYFSGAAQDVFCCVCCNRYTITLYEYNEFGDGERTCILCYGRQVLKSGQPLSDFDESHGISRRCSHRLPSNHWIPSTEITLAGYTCIRMTVRNDRDAAAVARGILERNLGACVILRNIAEAAGIAVLARPSLQRARDAAVTMCVAWRFDKGSTIGRLPRDVLGLLVKAVWATRFEGAWLNI
jgi:hypothetical protein